MWALGYLMVVLVVILGETMARTVIPIGAIFHEDNYDAEMAFHNALKRENMYNNRIEFVPIVHRIEPTNTYAAEKFVCGLASEGVAAVFGPGSKYASNIVASICNELGIPHILASWQPEPIVPGLNLHAHTRNFFPRSGLYASVLGEMIRSNAWNDFTLIYETSESLERLHDVLALHGPTDNPITVRQLVDGDDYLPFLKQIETSGGSNIILDCSLEKTVQLLKQAGSVKMLEDYQHYMIVSLDAHTIDFSTFMNKSVMANITMIRMMDPNSQEIESAVFDWREKDPSYSGYGSDVQSVRTEAALLYDAVHTFATTIRELNLHEEIVPQSMRCSANKESWEQGRTIIEHLTNKTTSGMTGRIIFDESGYRDDFYLEVVELTKDPNEDKFRKISHWNAKDKFVNALSSKEMEMKLQQSMQNRTLVVAMLRGKPWLTERIPDEDERFEGNDRYEGYSVDFISMLAKEMKFNYRIELVPGNTQGSYDPKTKKWTGVMKQLLDRKADLAICDLTITYQRRKVVDFTNPFMYLGISILFAKPVKKPADLFSFMAPLSLDVWMFMVTTYLIVSIVLFFIAKLSADDWENPHPCNDDPEELENLWNMHNSVWLTVGAIMQQGCDLLPKAVPTRLIVSLWWFFALIVTSSYTANLAAFLTKEQMEESLSDVEALAAQNKIQYGVVAGGATSSFFRESNRSTYQKMWSVMEANPSVFVKNNEQGADRVSKGKHRYAFLMESVAIEYIVNQNCKLTKIGGELDSKGYGIAMPFNSPYRKIISEKVLRMAEGGRMTRLKDKWWKDKNRTPDGKACDTDPKTGSNEMRMANVGGVFLVLLVGCLAGVLMGIIEFLWNVRNVAIEKQITQWEAFKSECLFALDLRKTTKPVTGAQDTLSTRSGMSLKSWEQDESADLGDLDSDRQMNTA